VTAQPLSLFELSSVFTPGEKPIYTLSLKNNSGKPISGFTFGFSGPGRVRPDTELTGGTLIHHVSNWNEFAPAKGYILPAGETWTLTIHGLEFIPKHWTDGAVTGILVLADGSVHSVLTQRTQSSANDQPYRSGIVSFPVPTPGPVAISVVPWPKDVAVSGHRTPPDGFAISAIDKAGKDAAQAFAELTTNLFPGEGLVRPLHEGGYPVTLTPRADLAAEAYELNFGADSAEVTASSQTGLLYGLITLGQILRGARLHLQSFSFPTAGTIRDEPQLGWRGCHWDVARRFYSTAEVSQFLRILAWNKLNRFHWHLSDDEAWRIEIDAYPELTAKAAWRGYGLLVPPLLGSGPEKTGGYYTKDAARQIIALGQNLGIEIVPEIDVPGHCYAMLEALPHLKDPGENGLYHSIQGFPNNCLNPGVSKVYAAIETIFAELCALFPSKYFHVGADEVPKDAWTSSPEARSLLQSLDGSDSAVLQAHFLQLIQEFLASKGKVTGAWEEAAHGGGIDKSKCYLVGWVAVESNRRLAAEGYDVVVAPGQNYYLDMSFTPEWHEPGANWAGHSDPEKTYAFTPNEGWSEDENARLMGIQGCIWCEPMTDRAVFERLIFPRLSAIAETGWTAPERKSWERFSAVVGLMPSLYGIREIP